MTNERFSGACKWFSQDKKFGFLVADDKNVNDGRDVFLHISALEKSGLKHLDDGQRVTFCLFESKGKIAATDIEVVG